MNQNTWVVKENIPAFSSTRFFAASALCRRTKARRSAKIECRLKTIFIEIHIESFTLKQYCICQKKQTNNEVKYIVIGLEWLFKSQLNFVKVGLASISKTASWRANLTLKLAHASIYSPEASCQQEINPIC